MGAGQHEKVLVLWANSSLGLVLHWWHANKQQSGRGSIGVSALETFPVLEVAKLGQRKLTRALKIFDDLCDDALLPIHQMDIDPVRAQIDERFGRDVLDLPSDFYSPEGLMALLRRKLANEPSIRGNK